MKLYVEKYDSMEGFLLLDFIYREDYSIFCERIDHSNSKNDPRTMLFLDELWFDGGNIPKEGKVYSMPEQLLHEVDWKKEPGYLANEQTTDLPFSNIISFRAFVDYKGPSYFDLPLATKFQSIREKELYVRSLSAHHYYKERPWHPCGAERITDDLKVIVRNVGQGNWNEIYCSNQCQVIYDIGGSIHATNQDVKAWVIKSNAFHGEPTLFISHWDVDHYLSLFEVTKESLERICCAYVPDKHMSLTSQRAFKLLYKYCPNVVAIPEFSVRKVKRKISLQLIFRGSNYAYFVGEQSSDINKSGLALAVWNKTSCVLFTGDHTYSQVFSDMLSCIPENLQINIVTPHHGGEAGRILNPSVKLHLSGTAVTSTGKNSYGHPLTKTRDDLLKMGFKWIRTDFENKDIEVCI